MERTFKIKTKSNLDPRSQYPSERRYSANIVIGLSIVHGMLCLCSILMLLLIIHKMTIPEPGIDFSELLDEIGLHKGTKAIAEDSARRLQERVEKDLGYHYYFKLPALVSTGCSVMILGTLFSWITGILAWSRWYIDRYITFFFLASTLSTLTSAISLLLSILTVVYRNFDFSDYSNDTSPVTLSLAVNIIILSTMSMIWSFMSTNIAYKGMQNRYPEDIVVSKGVGIVEVNTIRKGSKKGSVFPPDIINHFHVTGKLAKYLPQKRDDDLPKAESNLEYQQRVNKFLSDEPESTEHHK